MPPPIVQPIPDSYWRELPEKYDRTAVGAFVELNNHFGRWQPLPFYAHGLWGYTILRTVYTPESDALFPVAMERLKRLVHYWCHYTRFPAFGALCEEWRVDYAELNEELFRRCFLDVVEDREGLAHLDSGGPDRFIALADYFRQWVAGINTGPRPDKEPRFSSCLVIDSESLASLMESDNELPPLQCAATRKEKADVLRTGYPAWLWMIEAKYMTQPDERRDSYPGWLRVDPGYLHATWSSHLFLNDIDHWFCLGHKETPEGLGIYHHDPAGP
ncbi:hypothetical protein P885DRAFT_63492 [Corynascus similis CBS 632.67]